MDYFQSKLEGESRLPILEFYDYHYIFILRLGNSEYLFFAAISKLIAAFTTYPYQVYIFYFSIMNILKLFFANIWVKRFPKMFSFVIFSAILVFALAK